LKEGLFAGIEWSGTWQVRVARDGGRTSLQGGLDGFRHDLAPGETFEAPRRFMGFYKGDLDDAANASHDFVRRYLMRPRPANFPWTQYNTWFAYYTDLNEETLRHEVDIAAALGLEVFYVDAGWYVGSPNDADFSFGLGTWRENRDKFPSGLAAFADYVHSKGLKFGLWVEPERVDLQYAGPGTDISLDWISPVTDLRAAPPPGMPRVAQICFGHPEARAWAKEWLSRLIRDYQLDWLKWDSNLWMPCDPPDQPGDQDIAHVQGLYEILDYLHHEFPNLIIENCASGGNRMDYALIRRTDIAWLSDQTDPSYRVRYHVTGASYPFPPEYLNSWLVESYFEHMADGEKDPAQLRAWLRSRMMGAFGISTEMIGWSANVRAVVAEEIAQYETMRDVIAHGKIYRLLPQTELYTNLELPEEPDAAEFYDPSIDTGVVFLFGGKQPWTTRRLIPKGLAPETTYQVLSDDRAISLRRSGRQIAAQGITFRYDASHPSTVVFIRRAAGRVPP
jgi:alpha-galactosidase